MKGIILAGGAGTRLYPVTIAVCKQLLSVYNKPMIYYALAMHMLAGIRDILIITTPQDSQLFQLLLGDGKQWGMNFSYAVQDKPRGLADAFVVGKRFIGSDTCSLILGDNIFFGHGLPDQLRRATRLQEGALIFAYHVDDPRRYGVVEFDDNGLAISIEEKPEHPRTHWAVPGLYCYDNLVVEIAEQVEPSERGEKEITTVNQVYLAMKKLKVEVIGRGIAWLDAGTFDSLLEASNYVRAVESRQGMMISCPEEIAYRMGFINEDQFAACIEKLGDNSYRDYLEKVYAGN